MRLRQTDTSQEEDIQGQEALRHLAARIYTLRTHPDRRLSQAALARAIGCNKNIINRIERGHAKELNHLHLIKLAEYFEVTIDYLLGRKTLES